jgi:DNA invertase Pin-like site-specific DNA recombinase
MTAQSTVSGKTAGEPAGLCPSTGVGAKCPRSGLSDGTRTLRRMSMIGYARVSTSDQDTALRVDALTAAGVTRIFSDTASGAKTDREELAACLDYLRAGDTLVIWWLDRMGRSLRHLIEIVEELRAREIELLSLTDGIDTTTAGRTPTFHVFGALAEFERKLISERTKAGLAAARRRRNEPGRRRVVTDAKLRAALALKAERMPMRAIAEELGVSKPALYDALKLGKASTSTDAAPTDVESDP